MARHILHNICPGPCRGRRVGSSRHPDPASRTSYERHPHRTQGPDTGRRHTLLPAACGNTYGPSCRIRGTGTRHGPRRPAGHRQHQPPAPLRCGEDPCRKTRTRPSLPREGLRGLFGPPCGTPGPAALRQHRRVTSRQGLCGFGAHRTMRQALGHSPAQRGHRNHRIGRTR